MALKKKKSKAVKISIISNMADLLMPATAVDDMKELTELMENTDDSADLSIYSLLSRLASQSDGEPERIEFATEGIISDDGKRIEISYDETELSGMAGSHTTLLFDKNSPGLITLIRTGVYTTSLVFNAADRRQRCMYDTGILPPFELSVLTGKLENGLSYEGGRLLLDYVIEMHGVKTEYNSMLLEVREPRKPSMNIIGGEC